MAGKQKSKWEVVIEKDEDGYYVGDVPALPGCHTQGKSLDELMKNVKEAIGLYLSVEKDVKKRGVSRFVGVQLVEA